jgi:hypothetical protein
MPENPPFCLSTRAHQRSGVPVSHGRRAPRKRVIVTTSNHHAPGPVDLQRVAWLRARAKRRQLGPAWNLSPPRARRRADQASTSLAPASPHVYVGRTSPSPAPPAAKRTRGCRARGAARSGYLRPRGCEPIASALMPGSRSATPSRACPPLGHSHGNMRPCAPIRRAEAPIPSVIPDRSPAGRKRYFREFQEISRRWAYHSPKWGGHDRSAVPRSARVGRCPRR